MPDDVKRSIEEATGPAEASSVTGADETRPAAPEGGARTSRPGGQDTGAALRSVYQKTVDESVPDEMLDLLGKLS